MITRETSGKIPDAQRMGAQEVLSRKRAAAACANTSPVNHAANAVQAIGMTITIAGLVVVAPSAAGRAARATWIAVRDRVVRFWVSLVRVLLRRPRLVNSGTVRGTVAGPIAWNVHALPPEVIASDGSIKQELARLDKAIQGLRTDVGQLRTVTHDRLVALEARIDEVASQHFDLEQRLVTEARSRAELDTLGFPLAALGALFAGIPSAWLIGARWPLLTMILAAAVVALAVGASRLWASRTELQRGWREQAANTT